MIPFISKINNNQDFLTSGLLLEELNIKDFEKNKVLFRIPSQLRITILQISAPNIKEIATNDDLPLDHAPFLEESRLKEIANDAIERYIEKSVNLGQSSNHDKSIKEIKDVVN